MPQIRLEHTRYVHPDGGVSRAVARRHDRVATPELGDREIVRPLYFEAWSRGWRTP